MVIITGDHEGLADFRAGLCRTEAGKGIVSDQLFTPFIVINSPVGMRYEPVMGQVDIYPTLLNLLHIDTYFWKGMGQSILDPCKEPFAINPQYQFVGDTVGAIPEKTDFLKKSWTISDLLIRCDYWGRKQE